MKTSDYVIKSHIYGKKPHDVFIVRYNLNSETPSSVTLDKDVTLSALLENMGDGFIPQKEIAQVVEDLQEVGEVCFFPKDITAFAKEQVVRAITAYDTSDAVNQFSINGVSLWLDRNTRAALMRRFEAENASGIKETTLWYGALHIDLSVDAAITMLNAIEIYACQAFDVTASHKAAVEGLKTIDEIVGYDFAKDYPKKLEL